MTRAEPRRARRGGSRAAIKWSKSECRPQSVSSTWHAVVVHAMLHACTSTCYMHFCVTQARWRFVRPSNHRAPGCDGSTFSAASTHSQVRPRVPERSVIRSVLVVEASLACSQHSAAILFAGFGCAPARPAFLCSSATSPTIRRWSPSCRARSPRVPHAEREAGSSPRSSKRMLSVH